MRRRLAFMAALIWLIAAPWSVVTGSVVPTLDQREDVRKFIAELRSDPELTDFKDISTDVYGHVVAVSFSSSRDIGDGWRGSTMGPTLYIDTNAMKIVGCEHGFSEKRCNKNWRRGSGDDVDSPYMKSAVDFLERERPGFQKEEYRYTSYDLGELVKLYAARKTTKVERCYCYLIIEKSSNKVLGSGLVYEHSSLSWGTFSKKELTP